MNKSDACVSDIVLYDPERYASKSHMLKNSNYALGVINPLYLYTCKIATGYEPIQHGGPYHEK